MYKLFGSQEYDSFRSSLKEKKSPYKFDLHFTSFIYLIHYFWKSRESVHFFNNALLIKQVRKLLNLAVQFPDGENYDLSNSLSWTTIKKHASGLVKVKQKLSGIKFQVYLLTPADGRIDLKDGLIFWRREMYVK